jgi:bifunctional N-acetylglucosamine-1-phosphate-uridyltransferase/glucosamine-1-phosphate-acetyltransferase GlmU-like protein
MDAVILAAGRGQRLAGHATPFFKPLLEINGKPLIVHAVEYAHIAGAQKVVIVVSPQNRRMMESLFHTFDFIELVDQETPQGPGHALLVGLTRVTSKRAIALMSDNILTPDQVELFGMAAIRDLVGVTSVDEGQAARFTRLVRLANGTYEFREGGGVAPDEAGPNGLVTVWCGPLAFDAARMRAALASHLGESDGELKIGPYLGEAMRSPSAFPITSMDVGVPDAYKEVR